MGAQLEALERLQTDLKEAGVTRVWLDLEDVNPPGIWLAFDTFEVISIGGQTEAQVWAYLVTQHARQTKALDELDGLLEQLDATGVDGDGEVQLIGLRTTTTQRELFAYRVPINFTY